MSHAKRYSELLYITGYIILVLVTGALLAPPLFFLAQNLITANPDGTLAKILGDKEFTSYFNRAALVGALVGLIPLFKILRIDRREVLGSQSKKEGFKLMWIAFLLAAILLFIMGYAYLQADAYRVRSGTSFSKFTKPLISAFTVSLLEEFLFRGAILTILCRSLGKQAGLWWTTLLFAVVHFMKPPQDGALLNSEVTYASGFWVISQLLRGFGEVEYFIAEFCTLVAVGWALAQTRLSSQGLWVSIGLHAGWVFGLKYFGYLTRSSGALRDGEWLPWIGTNLKIGISPLLVVVLTGFLMLFIIKKVKAAKK